MSTNNNMDLWNRVNKTDPAAVKAITGKTYSGNSPKPYWLIELATKTFGACGIGWGVQVVSESFQQVSPTDYLHTAVVRFWYVWNGVRGEVEQAGGTKAAYVSSSGKTMVDEDAAKKSITDAMVKCMSMVGFAGDIFSGRWDDSKYVQEVAAEFQQQRQMEAETTEHQKRQSELVGLMADIHAAKSLQILSDKFLIAQRVAKPFPDLLEQVVKAKDERKAYLEQQTVAV